MEDITKRLGVMEELLISTRKQNRRILAAAVIMGVLLLLFVLIFGAGLLMLNQTVADATQELPALIQSIEQTSTELNTTLQDIQSIDYAGLNGAIQNIESGIGSINFEALNRSIVDLQIAAQRLAAVMSFFG